MIKKEQNGDVKGVIIFLLVLVICGLIGYIVYDDVFNKDKPISGNEEVLKEEPTSTEEEYVFNKAEVNKYLEELNWALYFTFGDELDLNNIVYDKEMLDENAKFDIAWYGAYKDKIEDYMQDVNSEGEEETGAYAISYLAFKDYYKNLFNEEWKGRFSDKYNFVLKDGMIYGGMYTGWGLPKIFLKINNVEKVNDTYVYTIDVVDNSLFSINFNEESNVVSYDHAVIYKLVLKIDKSGNDKYIKSLGAVKNK